MKKSNLLLGIAEIGAGIILALPFEDTLTAGASLPITTIAGVALVYDGIKRL